VETCARDGVPAKTTLPIDPLFNQRYRLLRRLGRGGISVVYLAREEGSPTERAIKIILPEYFGNSPANIDTFLQEAQKAFDLRHPNIVTVREAGVGDQSLPFLVMDFVSGPSLEELLSRGGPLTPAVAWEYLKGIGNGLSFAHAAGIVHGDLKPRNILLVNDKSHETAVRITDFGLSAIKSGKLREPAEEVSGLLRSPLYLAPEQWSEDEPDARTDIYSLGVILYEMLSGEPPFKGKTNAAIMKSHLRDKPPAIARRFPGVTVEIEQVVFQALEKEPARRPQSVESFMQQFQAALINGSSLEDEVAREEQPIGVADVDIGGGWWTTLQPILLALGVVLVITLIGIGVYYSRTSQ
jgi:serine/threonine-protein kinase